jgi:small subunit ribosomal protein S6e
MNSGIYRGDLMEFKVIISDGPKTYQKEIKGEEAARLVGLRIGEIFDGSLIGESGRLQITGGTDKDGFPMRRGITGSRRLKVLLKGGSGFIPQQSGERRKKMVRGDTISENIVQINTKLATEMVKPKKPAVKKKKEEKVTEVVEEKITKEEKPVKVKKEEKIEKEEKKAPEKPVKPKKVKEEKPVKAKKAFKKPGISVTKVKGIGKKTAELLAQADVTTVQELLDADMALLTEKTGLSTKQINNLKTSAQEVEG